VDRRRRPSGQLLKDDVASQVAEAPVHRDRSVGGRHPVAIDQSGQHRIAFAQHGDGIGERRGRHGTDDARPLMHP
jgi:hypothetical protein